MQASACHAPFPGLGGRLKKLRLKATIAGPGGERIELSARELDRIARIARGYTSALETGGRDNPAAWVVTNLARALGSTTDWLLSGLGPEPTEEQVHPAVAAARERYAKSGAPDEEG